MSNVDIAIGKRIVEACQAVGMTQCDLVADAELSQPTIRLIEKGERAASILKLVLIAGAFAVGSAFPLNPNGT